MQQYNHSTSYLIRTKSLMHASIYVPLGYCMALGYCIFLKSVFE